MEPTSKAVVPLNIYVSVQHEFGIPPELIRPVLVADVFRGMTEEDVFPFVRDLIQVFDKNLAMTVLARYSFEECRGALDRFQGRLSFLIDICGNCIGRELAIQVFRGNIGILFLETEWFLASLKNLKALIPGDEESVYRLRATFLSVFPQYFKLPPPDVQERAANGLTLAQAGDMEQLRRLLTDASGARAAQGSAPIPVGASSHPPPADPPTALRNLISQYVRIPDVQRYVDRLVKDCGSAERAWTFVSALAEAGWRPLYLSKLWDINHGELRRAGLERVLGLQRLLVETFGIRTPDAIHILSHYPILLAAEPEELERKIREATDSVAPYMVCRLLRQSAKALLEGRCVKKRPRTASATTVSPTPPPIAKPEPLPSPHERLRLMLTEAGCSPGMSIGLASRIALRCGGDIPAAEALVQAHLDAKWDGKTLERAFESRLQAVDQRRALNLQWMLEAIGLSTVGAIHFLVSHPTFFFMVPEILDARIRVALGDRPSPQACVAFFEKYSYLLRRWDAERLEQERLKRLSHGMDVRADPALWQEPIPVPKRIPPPKAADPVPSPPPRPAPPKRSVILPPPRELPPHIAALMDAEWGDEESARDHLSRCQWLRKERPDALRERFQALYKRAGLQGCRFVPQIKAAAVPYAQAQVRISAVQVQATDTKRLALGTKLPAERDVTKFLRLAHAFTPDTVDDALAFFRELGAMEDGARAVLSRFPWLLANQGNPIRVLRVLCAEGATTEALLRSLQDDEQWALLFEDPDAFVLPVLRDIRMTIEALAEALRMEPTALAHLDLTQDWTRAYLPIEELRTRAYDVYQAAPLIPLDRAQETFHALFLPTRAQFLQAIGEASAEEPVNEDDLFRRVPIRAVDAREYMLALEAGGELDPERRAFLARLTHALSKKERRNPSP